MHLLLLLACATTTTSSTSDTWPANAVDSGVAPAEDDTATPPALRINELMPANDSVIMDERGGFPDWVELFNPGEDTVSLAGYALRLDDDSVPLPNGASIPGAGRALFWLDNSGEPGHLALPLDRDGGTLFLDGPDHDAIDSVDWEEMPPDLALGRFPDGAERVGLTITATPNAANPSEPGASVDPTDAMFPQDRVLTIELWIPPDAQDDFLADPDTEVPVAVAFEGAWMTGAAVRRKGGWGSEREPEEKVALRVSIDRYDPGARLRGLEHLTLNNMVQDSSAVHELIAWRLMRDADVPGPRTAYVALYLNGEYRGLYLHVETPDERFLGQWFRDEEGNLYEGEYGDDLTNGGWRDLDQDREGAHDNAGRPELEELAALLEQTPTDALAEDLATMVDLPRTLRAMAAEVVIGHWDGYFYYPNNYRLYHDPGTDLITLMPWGLDQTLEWEGGIEDADGDLARWVLKVPDLRARYLGEVWEMNERLADLPAAEMVAQAVEITADAWAADPYREAGDDGMRDGAVETLAWIADRKADVEAELFPE